MLSFFRNMAGETRHRGMGCKSPRRNGTVSVRPFRSSESCVAAMVNHSGNRGRQESDAEGQTKALLSQVRIFGSKHDVGVPGGVSVHKNVCTGSSMEFPVLFAFFCGLILQRASW